MSLCRHLSIRKLHHETHTQKKKYLTIKKWFFVAERHFFPLIHLLEHHHFNKTLIDRAKEAKKKTHGTVNLMDLSSFCGQFSNIFFFQSWIDLLLCFYFLCNSTCHSNNVLCFYVNDLLIKFAFETSAKWTQTIIWQFEDFCRFFFWPIMFSCGLTNMKIKS